MMYILGPDGRSGATGSTGVTGATGEPGKRRKRQAAGCPGKQSESEIQYAVSQISSSAMAERPRDARFVYD